ncbi:hypothetical protein CKJ70_25935 [Mycobacterium avium]|nr:hypothetical protein CKJ70_25935 [Mycobacterium avium]
MSALVIAALRFEMYVLIFGVFQSQPSGSAGMASRAGLVDCQALQVELSTAAFAGAGAPAIEVGAGAAGAAVLGPRERMTAPIRAAARMMAATMIATGSHRRAGWAGG